MDIHQAFKFGALQLARNEGKYSELHKAHGIDPYDWEIFTQQEYWTRDQAATIRTILAQVIEVSMTIAGMPAIPMPGHYAAAVIATCVAPCNRMVACMKCPDTFDAVDASGILGTSEIKTMSHEQVMALVLAYSGGFGGEPVAHRLPKETSSKIERATKR